MEKKKKKKDDLRNEVSRGYSQYTSNTGNFERGRRVASVAPIDWLFRNPKVTCLISRKVINLSAKTNGSELGWTARSKYC